MLKRFLFALSVTTALCMPGLAEADTISDSVTQALLTHPQMKAGAASLSAADKNVWEQKSTFFPVLNVNGSAGRMRNNDETTRGATADAGAASSWIGQGTVTLTQPIFDGFGKLHRVNSAKGRASAATYDLAGMGEDISLRAARAHLNMMRTRDLLSLASQYLSKIEARRLNIAMMVKEGAADAAELLQADEIQMAAKNSRLGYEESYRQAMADYAEAVGADPAEKLEFGEPHWNALIPGTVEDAVAYAVSKNARALSAASMVSAMASETSAEKSGLGPRVDAEVSYDKKDQADVVGGESTSAKGMLRLGWNFSTGGGQFARIGKLRQQQEEAMARRQTVIRGIERDMRQKYASMQIVDQQFALLAEREKSSEKVLENFLAQFEGGKQSNLQLIAAHAKFFEAKVSRTDAYYRRLLARFELLNVGGRLREALTDSKPQTAEKD